jgi:hypothetical protein
MRPRRNPLSKRLGSALVMTLVIIVLITVVTVGYLASVMLETKTAGSSLDQERAYGIAMVGAHQAMAKIREALGPWDDPYKNFAASNPPFYWSLSPGRITRWSYSSVSPQTNIGLFSESAGTDLVNLNRQLIDGSYPIIGGSNAPEVSVKWANLLRDPSQPSGSNNAIVGRYAFWVDDESAKINVNTADGTEKYTTNSLGVGTPSEVSLSLALGGTNTNSIALTKQVVQMARTNGFTSPREIRRAGVTNSAFADNVFSLTAHGRAPELNVFGEPRLSVAPLLGNAGLTASNMVTNSLTLLPVREIYPTPAQTRPYLVASRYDIDHVPRNHPWPMALRGELGVFSAGVALFHPYKHALEEGPRDAPNYSYNQGFLLANYLAGTNDVGRPLTWPVFPGSSTRGFAGKYTLRQLDSLVAQILSIGSKAISSDYPNVSGTPDGVGDKIGHRFMVVPYLFPGWLSGKWVNGIGRSIKLTQMYMEIAAFPAEGTWDPAAPEDYTPPQATFDIWLEWWLPAGYFGGRKVLDLQDSEFFVGHRSTQDTLNVIDMPRDLSTEPAAPIPRLPDGDSPEADSFWANQLLRNNQGIDFAGNPGVIGGNPTNMQQDHSQILASNFHDPFALFNPSNSAGPWKGDGRAPAGDPNFPSGKFHDYASPFFMSTLETNNPTSEWQPGEMRVIRSRLGAIQTAGSDYRYSMQTNVSTNSTLEIRGGIAVKTQMRGDFLSDPDPVPLEAIRGSYDQRGVTTEEPYTGTPGEKDESQRDAEWAINTPGEGTLRERVLASVIPVNTNVSINNGRQVVAARVEDPLVNKFPGDWIISSASMIATNTDRYNDIDSIGGNFRSRLTDPDSYWMPQADAGLCTSVADVAAQTQIPRSARMPNVGYLQYVRTGIIPDDEETVPYASQKGTPFRLLSYAPSTDASMQTTTNAASESYPDWALLDLFYIPSTLAPYGSAYGPPVPNPVTNTVETKLLYYGTFGGATAGKVNPNGAVIYTTNADVAQTNVSRRLPLESVLSGVRINQTITGVSTNATFTNGSVVDASTIAEAIESYIRTNAPLRMPAEICNVPEIADLHAPNNPTRNDLVRQVVGALTTQGNVFSVWTVGQAVNKKPANTDYGEFEAGDNVLAEVRMHFIVERYLDPGADGLYGNYGNDISKRGPDTNATYDDQIDENHPFQPRYLYRVLASEEIR